LDCVSWSESDNQNIVLLIYHIFFAKGYTGIKNIFEEAVEL